MKITERAQFLGFFTHSIKFWDSFYRAQIFGILFTEHKYLGFILQSTNIWDTFYRGKSYVLILTIKGLANF
jgi:hypothetical protein